MMKPTNLTTLRPSEIAMAVLARAESAIASAEQTMNTQNSYRIQFAVQKVGPVTLPHFAYVTSAISFDYVLYTAIIQAADLDAACASVQDHWPEAVFREAEEGVNSFRSNDSHLSSHQFGCVRIVAKPTLSERFAAWVRSFRTTAAA